MSNSGTTHTGGGGGAGKANFQDLSFTKWVDLASAALMLATANGKHITKATLTVRKAGENPLEYITIEMDEVLVTSVSTGGSGGEDRLTENVSLNFKTVDVTYKGRAKTGDAGGKASSSGTSPATRRNSHRQTARAIARPSCAMANPDELLARRRSGWRALGPDRQGQARA